MRAVSPDRWARIEALFAEALDRAPGERVAYLDAACAGDTDLRADLDCLLNAHEQAAGFLDALDPERVADLIGAEDEGGLLTEGQAVGRYQILEKLGGGGMGVVYRARDPRLGRTVALKLLPPHRSADAEAKARLVAEARAASALDHPNICTVYEIGETDGGQLFIAMACYEGSTLREWLQAGPLPLDDALEVGRQIARALAAAHRRGIVHRDVKPSNIIVVETDAGRPQAKLLDFGVAKVDQTLITREGVTLGTVAYMSPEQTRGASANPRSDLWSLGVVLYEMLTGQRPFPGTDEQTVIYGIRNDQPEPVERLRPEVPAALGRVIERCLAKTPEERVPTADALLAELDSLPAEDAAGRWRSVLRVAGLAALLALMIASALSLVRRAGETAPEGVAVEAAAEASVQHRIAVLPFADVGLDPEDAYIADGLTDGMITRLSELTAVRVTARTSVADYADLDSSAADLGEIGRNLGVESVLGGRVRDEGDRIHISVWLADAASAERLWTDEYEKPLRELPSVQNAIAERVADALGVPAAATGQREQSDPAEVQDEAYNLYLRGRYFMNKRDEASLHQSRDLFEQALDVDPTYARAWAGLANAYTLLGSYQALSPEEAHPRARAAAEKALALDDELAEAHNALAASLTDYYFEWETAARHFRRAIELDPSYATAHQWYASNYLLPMGNVEEALVELRVTQALDPLSPAPQYEVGQALYFARRYDEADDYLRRLRDLYPTYPLISVRIGLIASLQGRHDEAIAAVEAAHASFRMAGGFSGPLAYVYAAAGRPDDARRVLRELEEQAQEQPATRRMLPFHEAYIYIGLGRYDRAITELEQVYENRLWFVQWLETEPVFDPLRSKPRYKALVERVGLAGD